MLSCSIFFYSPRIFTQYPHIFTQYSVFQFLSVFAYPQVIINKHYFCKAKHKLVLLFKIVI